MKHVYFVLKKIFALARLESGDANKRDEEKNDRRNFRGTLQQKFNLSEI